MFPPNVVSHIGKYMDTASRCNAFLASKCFGAIHESEDHHCVMSRGSCERVGKAIEVLSKLKPRLQSLEVVFTNHMNNNYYSLELPALCSVRSSVRINLVFRACTVAFITRVLLLLQLQNKRVDRVTMDLDQDHSTYLDIKALVDTVNSSNIKNTSLTLSDHPLHYTMLQHSNFAKKVSALEMNISSRCNLPIDINLDHIETGSGNTAALNVYAISRVKSLVGVHRLTSLYLNSVNSYFAIGTALGGSTEKLNLQLLMLDQPIVSYAYDGDSPVYRMLARCKGDNVVLRVHGTSDPDMPAFINHVFKHHGYKHVELGVHGLNDMVCARVMQLIHPDYDIRLFMHDDMMYFEDVLKMNDMHALHDRLDEGAQWGWYWLKQIAAIAP